MVRRNMEQTQKKETKTEMEIEITEYIDNLAARNFVELVGTVPKDNEALFTRMRMKRQLLPRAQLHCDSEKRAVRCRLKLGDLKENKKDSLLEKYYLNRWEEAYLRAILQEIRIRISEGLEGEFEVAPAASSGDSEQYTFPLILSDRL